MIRSIMGNHCSTPRRKSKQQQNQPRTGVRTDDTLVDHPSSLRHAIVAPVPDASITNLYLVQDKTTLIDANGSTHRRYDGRNRIKSLAALASDALCRALPWLQGTLPEDGVPTDVMQDLMQSLVQHAALNATTLRLLRHAPWQELSLSSCRGVTDQWLAPLQNNNNNHNHNINNTNSTSTTTSSSTAMTTCLPALYPSDDSMECEDEGDNNDDNNKNNNNAVHQPQLQQDDGDDDEEEDQAFFSSLETKNSSDSSSCASSTQTFCSATSATATTTKMTTTTTTTTTSPCLASHLEVLDLRGCQRITDQGLLQLGTLTRLQVALLDHCHALHGRGLAVLQQAHESLHTLHLNHCRRLTDEALWYTSHLVALQHVSLAGCRCLTDCALQALQDLIHLRTLNVSQCDCITNQGLAMLDQMTVLEELQVGWCRSLTDTAVEIVAAAPGRAQHLRVLGLARCHLTDACLSHLAKLSALQELDLNGCHLLSSNATGRALQQLPNLTCLDVSYCPNIVQSGWQGKIGKVRTLDLCYAGVTDGHLQLWEHLPALCELNLDSCPVGDVALGHLANRNVTPNLTALDLADTDLTDAGMVHIGKFKKLTHLSIFYCDVSNRGLRHLAQLENLETLNLDSRDISDEGLRHLRKLTKLKNLDIFSGRITDVGCSHLSKIKSLETLELCGGSIGDQGCCYLGSLENLTSLNLSQNDKISNRGAAALAALTKLKALNLSNTKVTGSALRYFSGLYELQSLSLYGCPGVQPGPDVSNLRDALPKLKCLRLNSVSDTEGKMIVATGNPFVDMPMEEDDTDMDIYSDHD